MTTAAATITASTLDDIRTTAPQVPMSLEQTGLTTDMVEQLLVKTLYGGELTGLMLAERLRLPFTIIEPIIERIRLVVNGVAARPLRLETVEALVQGRPRNESTAVVASNRAIEGAQPLRFNGYKVPLMKNLVKRAIRGVEGGTWTS